MQIASVAVIGAGTMGAGIAQICAQAGWRTNLFDAFPESLQRGMKNIDSFWDKGIARGKTTAEQKQQWAANLHPFSDMQNAVCDVDLVIEAVPEIPSLKHQIFADLGKMTRDDCILGTNTSSLSIKAIAEASTKPEKVIGMHFFNPVPIMKLLELVEHDSCSEQTIAFAQAAGKAMGKTTILVKDVPGFATSRLGVVLGNEAIRMLADGVASAKDIDTAMVLGYKHPMGPLALTDLVGLDVRRDILLNLKQSFNDDSYTPHPLLEKLVAEGRLGKKSGKGIYDWSSGSAEETELP
ncbi:MAG: 3-hydroxyacyl-CoA dehydrogenase family protein [archaeon]|nr:3-hydroxyacyl-CoA dehydrogenase family protein [archaeon]MDA1130221.1 3-hydroxyacyl-CoA dehydrogenase family protein [archaeon]